MGNLLKGLPGENALQGDLVLTDTDETTELWKLEKATGVMTSAVAVGAKNGATVTVVEKGSGVVHQTVLTLAATPLTSVSVTTGNGVGGYKIYTFPEGHIRVLGCTADLALAIGAAKQADFTDATPEGDIGVGSVLPGTDATDDDYATGAAFVMAAYADADIVNPPEAAANFDGSGAAKTVNVNLLVDAADIDNDVTTEVECTGVVTLTWVNLGDY